MLSYYAGEELKQFCKEVLIKIGIKDADANVVADSLIRADSEGVDSHGISRLPIYSKRLIDNRININPKIELTTKSTSVLSVNGDNGLGHIVSYHALQMGVAMAKRSGVVAIGINNSNHFGAASYFCQLACEQNLACIGFTNSPPGIAPWGGKTPFFGTNPVAFGFPTGNDTPVIIDLSTSIVARGKIILAAKQGKKIPDGWAIDKDGNPTNEPNEALNGSVLPMGGAKGSALALAVEVLTGILSSAAFGPHVNSIYDEQPKEHANVGHFFILLDIEKFMPIKEFTVYLNMLLKEMKEVPKMPGVEEIRYPGERRKKEASFHNKEGIFLSSSIQEELRRIGDKFHVPFPAPLADKTTV